MGKPKGATGTRLSRITTPDGFNVYCSYDEIVTLDTLKANPNNPNKHPDIQIGMLANIISDQGWRAPITVSKRSGFIVRGHARRLAGYKAGSQYVPVEYQDYESEASELADLIADNRIAELAVLDENAVSELLQQMEVDTPDFALGLTGFTDEQVQAMLGQVEDAGEEEKEKAAHLTLKERFLVPPFSILDARRSDWMTRKQAWKQLGIQSELGRGCEDDKTKSGLTFNKSSQPLDVYEAKNAYEKKVGKKITWDEFTELFPDKMAQGGTSIFDPVLCEIVYRWFCPKGGSVIDPFAGGSVRGIVAALTGRKYTGVDLSSRQIEANLANWQRITHESILAGDDEVSTPHWINGDSMHIDELAAGKYDLFFTCPPYADLEIYSDKPEDLSNKDYPEFLELYREIIKKTTSMLNPNSFACIVVGDVRDRKGFYYNFISDTIRAFLDAGLKLYNEAILITPYGSLPIRVGNQFKASRKLGKTHQNLLVFCNGNPKQNGTFRTDEPELYEKDINDYLKNGAGRLGVQHQKVLVFSKGNPAEASQAIGVPETREEAEEANQIALFESLLKETGQ